MEGLEFNRRLSIDEIDENLSVDRKNLKGNETSQILPKNNNESPSSTFLSKKVFIYTDLRNRSQTISEFRSGKFAPKRPVKGTKIMYELITIGSKIKSKSHHNSHDEKRDIKIRETNNIIDKNGVTVYTESSSSHGYALSSAEKKKKNHRVDSGNNFGNYFAEIEWPGGRKTRTEKITISRESGEQFSLLDVLFGDFNERSDLGVQYNIINFMRGKPKKPFNRWISFASPPDKISSGRSQEYYTIAKERITFTPLRYFSDVSKVMKYKIENFEKVLKSYSSDEIKTLQNKLKNVLSGNKIIDSTETATTQEIGKIVVNENPYEIRPIINRSIANLKYKRYGEGPSWYSIGRSTATEISAKRYNSIDHLPAYIIELVDLQCPTFIKDSSVLLSEFRSESDLLDNYKPWYSGFTRIFKRKRN